MMCRLWALLSVVIAERYSQGVNARRNISHCWPQCFRGKSVIKSVRAPVCGIFKHQWIILRNKAVVIGWICVKVFVNCFLPKQSFRRRERRCWRTGRFVMLRRELAVPLCWGLPGTQWERELLPVSASLPAATGGPETGWVMTVRHQLLPCVLGPCLVWGSPRNPGVKRMRRFRSRSWTAEDRPKSIKLLSTLLWHQMQMDAALAPSTSPAGFLEDHHFSRRLTYTVTCFKCLVPRT